MKNQNHHFVPRTYLKSFADRDGYLYVFDKTQNDLLLKKWSNIKSTASEMNFYQLPEDSIRGDDVHIVEKWLADEVDKPFGEKRAQVEKHVLTRTPLDPSLIGWLAWYIGVQAVRTRNYRDFKAASFQQAIESLKQQGIPTSGPTPEQVAEFHANDISEGIAPIFAALFMSWTWVIGINDTELPFYTSDSPVIRRLFQLADGSSVDRAAFPLSPKHILIMLDDPRSSPFAGGQTEFMSLSEESVAGYNQAQIFQSHRRVFSKVDNLEVCRRVCDAFPALRRPDSPKRMAEEVMSSDAAIEAERQYINRIKGRGK